MKLLNITLFFALALAFVSCNKNSDEQKIREVIVKHMDYALDFDYEGFKTLLNPRLSTELFTAIKDEFDTDGFKERTIYLENYNIKSIEITTDSTARVEIDFPEEYDYSADLIKIKDVWYINFL